MNSGLAQAIIDQALLTTAVTVFVIGVFAAGRYTASQDSSRRSSTPNSLRRSAGFVTILDENEEGYGIAIQDMNHCTELVRFNSQDEIYGEVHLHDEQLAMVADSLSERACERERDVDE